MGACCDSEAELTTHRDPLLPEERRRKKLGKGRPSDQHSSSHPKIAKVELLDVKTLKRHLAPSDASDSTGRRSGGKLRVLCLHGTASNKKIMQFSLRSIMSQTKDYVEFVAVDAPIRLNDLQTDLWGDPEILRFFGKNLSYFLWYKHEMRSSDHKRSVNLPTAQWYKGTHVVGLENSLKALAAVYREQGPFDGVLGFSQGAAMATLLAALKPSWFRFVISLAGFVSPPAESIFDESSGKLPPLLHVHGEGDATVSLAHGKHLCSKFQEARVVTFRGGHRPPAKGQSDAIEAIITFLQKHHNLENRQPREFTNIVRNGNQS